MAEGQVAAIAWGRPKSTGWHTGTLALGTGWGPACNTLQVGGGVGEAWGLTWKGRSTVPLPIWFTLGRDPP